MWQPPGMRLEAILRAAKPSWSEKDLSLATEKLKRVGVKDLRALSELLTNDGLNTRLHEHGLKAFTNETLLALRQRIEELHFPLHAKGPEVREVRAEIPPGQGALGAQLLGETPLIAAVRSSDVGQVREILAFCAAPDDKDLFGETALMEAAGIGHRVIVQLLLDAAADPSYRAPNGLMAGDLAKEHSSLAPLFVDPHWRETAVRRAAGQHDAKMLGKLLDKFGETPLELALPDIDGQTALHCSSAKAPDIDGSGAEVVRLLVQAAAAVNAANLLGETALIVACRTSADTRGAARLHRLEVVGALMQARAAVNASDSLLHETPLMEAAGIGDVELLRLLLRGRADPTRRSASGLQARDFAFASEVLSALEANEKSSYPIWTPQPGYCPYPKNASSTPGTTGKRGPNTAVPPDTPLESWRRALNQKPKAQQPPPSAPPSAPQPPPSSKSSSTSAPSAKAQPPTTANQRIQAVLSRFPGFSSAGLQLPLDAWQWTVQELELFVGSMGQLWPVGRKRPNNLTGPNVSRDSDAKAPRPPKPKPAAAVLRPHYQALEVPDGTTDRQTLKKAYRQAALRWHPDKNAGDPGAQSRFQAALNAFEFLCQALDLGND